MSLFCPFNTTDHTVDTEFSGTTMSAALIRGENMTVFNVGDSRVTIAMASSSSDTLEAEAVSQDHKPDLPIEKVRLTCGLLPLLCLVSIPFTALLSFSAVCVMGGYGGRPVSLLMAGVCLLWSTMMVWMALLVCGWATWTSRAWPCQGNKSSDTGMRGK